MSVEQQVDALATSVDELTGAVVTKTATLDASVVDAQSATAQAQDAKTNALSARDEAGAFKEAAYTAAQSAASAVAYQDLTALAAEKAVTVVDVFIYDTSKDSDGGAWRHRCAGTSWFNEPLNTATRGSRREFPAVAVIVAEADKVTIYDGDDPALPMWMVFDKAGSSWGSFLNVVSSSGDVKLAVMQNGKLVVTKSQFGGFICDVLKDKATSFYASGASSFSPDTVASRNDTSDNGSGMIIVAGDPSNDVAMTVLPDAPIDPATGLPVPTIAVATDGGVSAIRDDGSVISANTHLEYNRVAFDKEGLWSSAVGGGGRLFFGSIDAIRSGSGFAQTMATANGAEFVSLVRAGNLARAKDGVAWGGPNAAPIGPGLVRHIPNYADQSKGVSALTTSTYNTGWMNGDIKLAALSDTVDTDLVGSGELVPAGQPTSTIDATVSAGSTKEHLWSMDANPSSLIWDTGQTNPVGWYKIVAPLDPVSASTEYLKIGSTAGGQEAFSASGNGGWDDSYYLAVPWRYVTYVRTDADLTPDFEADTPSVKLADADRSVNNNGLIVNGTVTRSPVAPGAELVAYSGFSASNYLEQPYNPDLDFGTGDFCVMGWCKNLGNSTERILFRFDGFDTSDASGWDFRIKAYDDLEFSVGGAGINVAGSVPASGWSLYAAVRESGVIRLFVNGEEVGSTSFTADVSNPNSVIRIGSGYLGVAGIAPLALWRISATAPTAEQIKRIYEDEKVLFQENAQATLYGTSDAVTALAHDPDTGLLHIGTSAGRSVFKGLRRVANTTVPVGAAIAAAGGMVVEE